MTTLPWMPSSWASLSTTWHGLNKQLVLTGPQPLHLTPHQLSLPCRMLWPHQRTDLPKFTCSPMSPAHDSCFSLAVFTFSILVAVPLVSVSESVYVCFVLLLYYTERATVEWKRAKSRLAVLAGPSLPMGDIGLIMSLVS